MLPVLFRRDVDPFYLVSTPTAVNDPIQGNVKTGARISFSELSMPGL